MVNIMQALFFVLLGVSFIRWEIGFGKPVKTVSMAFFRGITMAFAIIIVSIGMTAIATTIGGMVAK